MKGPIGRTIAPLATLAARAVEAPCWLRSGKFVVVVVVDVVAAVPVVAVVGVFGVVGVVAAVVVEDARRR